MPIPSDKAASLEQEARAAADTNNYSQLAICLSQICALPPDDIQNLVGLFPLVEQLGRHRAFLDSQNNTGQDQALCFFKHFAQNLFQVDERREALKSYSVVMRGFVELSPFLAADAIAYEMVSGATQEVKNAAAEAVTPLLDNPKFQTHVWVGLLAKLSHLLYRNGFEDKAARCAQNWRHRLDAMSLEDALAQVMTIGPRMDCGSPLETEALDFVTKRYRESARKYPDLTQQVLDHLLTFSRPGGVCSVEVHKKLQALLITVEKRGDAINVRHRGSGLERYEF